MENEMNQVRGGGGGGGWGLCKLSTNLGLTVVKIAPRKVIGDSNGDKFFSVWYYSETNWNSVEWCILFYKRNLQYYIFTTL